MPGLGESAIKFACSHIVLITLALYCAKKKWG
jgi:hypothetical protein